jgi:hypothetical protein
MLKYSIGNQAFANLNLLLSKQSLRSDTEAINEDKNNDCQKPKDDFISQLPVKKWKCQQQLLSLFKSVDGSVSASVSLFMPTSCIVAFIDFESHSMQMQEQ